MKNLILWYRKVYSAYHCENCTLRLLSKAIFLLLIFLVLGLRLVFSQEEEPFVYNDKGRRDPFLALVDKDGRYLLDSGLFYSSDELQVSGILWDPQGKSSALINNQIVAVGEFISGYQIKEITKDSVRVSKDGKDYTIRVSLEK